MPIIGTLPVNIQDGQQADAGPVMANYQWIVDQVNANAQPISGATAFGRVIGNLGGTNQVLASTSTQAIILTNVLIDPLSEYSGGVYTASAGGIYQMQWVFSPTTTGALTMTSGIRINSVSVIAVLTTNPTSRLDVGITFPLGVGDTVEFIATRDATVNSVSGLTYASYGSIVRVA